MPRRNALQQRKVPVTLTRKVSSHSSASISHSGLLTPPTPLLLTSTTTRPNSASAARAAASMESASRRSSGTTRARRPCDRITSATSSIGPVDRPASTTSAPSAAILSAISRPMPVPAPVTAATEPSSSMFSPFPWPAATSMVRGTPATVLAAAASVPTAGGDTPVTPSCPGRDHDGRPGLLHRQRVHRGARRAGDRQGSGGEHELVDPVPGAVPADLPEVPDLAEGDPHVHQGDDVQRLEQVDL